MGSFSKVMFPTIRIGYLIAPPSLVEPLRNIRAALDGHPASTAQPALAEFIEEGHFASHMRRMRKIYGQRQTLFIDIVRRDFTDLLDVEGSPVGMSLVGQLKNGMTDQQATEVAELAGIDIAPIGSYFATPVTTKNLHFGYTATNDQEITDGLRRLCRVLS